jgi:2-polyprenyl-6-methoxyphenol hydroxylase-like FAD-dependent oxidoreductase
MTPFTAAGATQALEDAGTLLGLFKNIKTKEEVKERLGYYDKVRLVRATRIQTGSSMPFKDGRRNGLVDESVSFSVYHYIGLEGERDRDSTDRWVGIGKTGVTR